MDAIAPIKAHREAQGPAQAGLPKAPSQPSEVRGDHVEVDPEAYQSEAPLNLNLDEFRANQGAVTSTVGLGAKVEEVATGDSGNMGSVARQVGKATGPLNAVFGARDAAEGVRQMKDGQVAEGGLKTAQGTATSASGTATAVKSLASTTSRAGAVAAKVAGPLGAVGAGIGAAKDLNEGLEVGKDGVQVKDGEKVATGGAKAAGAGLLAAGVVCPPAALAGTAVVAGTTIYENREKIGDAAKKVGSSIQKMLA